MTYYAKADWSRAFNQYAIVFEVDMIYLMLILHLSSQGQCLLSFQGLSPCSVLKLLQTEREAQNS